jgi:hypothetical protein
LKRGHLSATEGILRAAAYSDVEFEEVHEPVYYGSDAESAFRFVCGFSTVMDVVESQPARERERTLERLRDVMDAHAARDGVWLDSRAWIIRARCA